jgi:molybdopterin molybdotransferase
MIPFNQALALVKNSALTPSSESVPFMKAINRVLAEEVYSDTDLPPFDKSAMDGFACRKEDLALTLTVIETIPAGTEPSKWIGEGQCARIMTGSPLPPGANCVIKVEETETGDSGQIRFTGGKTHHNICYRGEDIQKGESVLDKGTLLKPQHIAVLATVGKTQVQVYKPLRAGILSTGDELVEPEVSPGKASIRNSNAWQLMAQCEKIGLITTYYGIAKDDKADLIEKIIKAAESNDLVLITGGVSLGDYDLVPAVIREAGYSVLFQKIAVQPGSPTLFATRQNKCIFALPGNPVSSFVQFELLVKPFAFLSMGHDFRPADVRIPLASAYSRKKAERLSLVPVIIDGDKATLIDYHGSAHINAYTLATGIMSIDPGVFTLEEGELVHVRLL